MCKGTTNWEDVYIIPMNKIPQETLEHLNKAWVRTHGGIPVDKCIGKEVEELIVNGVITFGSCCGHGDYYSHVLILVEEKEKIETLGYTIEDFHSGLVLARLKSGTQTTKSFWH